MGGASITTDSTSGGFAFVPKPTPDNPNPIGTVFGPTGSITTVNTTGGVLGSGAINTSINTNQGIANFGRVIIKSDIAGISTTTGALVVSGGVGIAGALYIANTGDVSANIGSLLAYAGGQAAGINSINANLGTATTNITTLFSNAAGQSNQITGANTAIVTANSAVVSFIGTINTNLSTAITGNTNAANAAIVTANTSLKSYVDTQNGAITTAWTANAASQANQITGANAAIVTANSAVVSFIGTINNNLSTAITANTNAANTAIVTANSAVVSFVGTINNNLSTAIIANINAANAVIVTANTSLKSYVDTQDNAITTAWTANAATQAASIRALDANLGTATTNITTLFSNAATQATSINTINANLGTATTSITTLFSNAGSQQTQINSLATGANANVAAYLPTYSGSLNSLSTLTTSGNATVGGTLNVTGNLNVSGTTTTFSSNNVSIADALLYLADGNTGDVLDIGLVSAFTNPGYQHTGLVRDASDGVWKLFANVVAEPTTTVNFTFANYSPLRIGALTATSGTYSGAIIASTVSAGTIGNSGATLTGTLSSGAQNNITSATGITALGTITSLAATTLAATNFSSGNVNFTNATSGTVSTANVSLYESVTATTTNATHYPVLSGITTGNTAGFTASGLTFNPSTNVLAATTVSATTLTGTLSTAAQTNITSVGTLTGLTVNAQFSGNTAHADSDPGNYDGGQIIAFANQNNITGVSFSPTDRRILTMGIGPVRRPFLRTGSGVPFELQTGNVIIASTTTSASTTTGALVVAGGVGIAGRVTAGNIVTTNGVYWANGAAYSSGGGGGITYTTSNTAPSSPSAGNFWYEPATDIKYQYINDGTSSYWVDQSYPTSFGNLTVANTLTVNGSIVGTATNANYSLAANVAIYESVTATTTNATFYPMLSGITTGNTASFTSSSLVYNPSTGNLVVASTTASTSTTTGALVVSGGVGISGNIVTAGTANKFTGCVAIGSSNPTHKLQISADGYNTRISDSTNVTGYNIGRNTTDGLLYFYGDQATYNGYVFSGADGERVKISSTGNLVINATTTSTTTTTGALVVKGGAGVAGTMTVGGTITGKTNTGGVAAVSNDAGTMSIRGDNTNAAVISFHRPSVYAINMGLDTDNVFKIGGWSATANCFQLTGAGALTLTGGITTTGNIVPSANLTYNLGSTTAWWNNVYGVSVQAKYADLAEHYTADDLYGPGTVVVFGGAKEITVSNISHDPRVAGVISTNPAYLMNAANAGLPVALTGRVPCQVQGPVAKGDRLVNIDTGIAGRLDPALHEYGCIVGKSLGEIADDSIQTIEIVVGRF
jgi:hypothetical protein